MTYEAHRETVGRYTVRVIADDHHPGWEDALCDEPVVLACPEYRYGRNMAVQHDNSKRLTERALHAAWLFDRNSGTTGLADLCDVLDVRFEDHRTPTGRLHIKADIWDWKGRTFRDDARAAATIFEHETGLRLADVRFETFDTRSDTYLLAWYQPELDEYAGVTGAKAPGETVRAYLDGDVWGFIVGDAEDDHRESVWGFIGDSEYALEEGRSEAQAMEARARRRDAEAYAEAMLEARPDLAPCYA